MDEIVQPNNWAHTALKVSTPEFVDYVMKLIETTTPLNCIEDEEPKTVVNAIT